MAAEFVATVIPALIGVSALTVDAANAFVTRVELQNAADAAALAAAIEIKNGGTLGDATSVADAWAVSNGYSGAQVFMPPLNGPHAGKPDHIQVELLASSPTFFARFFGMSSIAVSARAVAEVYSTTPPWSLLMLDDSLCWAFNKSGGGHLQVAGGIQVNSSCSNSAMRVVDAGNVEAAGIQIVGGYVHTGGGALIPAPTTGVLPEADPLRSVPVPSGLPLRSASTLTIGSGSPVWLDPGVYVGGIVITASAPVTLSPGVYVLQGGGLSIAGSGPVGGSGVLIYNTCDNGDCAAGGAGGDISYTGTGTLTLMPASKGPYANLLIFQDRSLNARLHFAGGSIAGTRGTIYAPLGVFDVLGPVDNALQLIVASFEVSGSASVILQYDAQRFYQVSRMRLVE